MRNTSINDIISRFISSAGVPKDARIAFWQWLFADEEREAKEEALRRMWDETPEHPDRDTLKALDEAMGKLRIDPERKNRRRLRIASRTARIAAMLAIPVLSVATAWLYVRNAVHEVAMTETIAASGERTECVLPDGTRVTLNAESVLFYPNRFRGDTRTVYLAGEANFDVAKDADRPFIVKTSQIAVTALGTKFNVQAYPDAGKTVATLEQGAIKVQRNTDTADVFFLRPDEQAEYIPHLRQFGKSAVDASAVAGWTRGELNFINCSLREIVARMRRHYNAEITIDTPPDSGDDLYTIKLRKGETLRRAMQIVALTVGGIRVHFESERSVVLVNAPQRKKGGRQA